MATSGCQRSLFDIWQLVKPNHNLKHCVQHLPGKQKPNPNMKLPMPSTLTPIYPCS